MIHDPGQAGQSHPVPFLAVSGDLQIQRVVTVQARQGLWCHTDPQDHCEGLEGLWEGSRHPGVRGS